MHKHSTQNMNYGTKISLKESKILRPKQWFESLKELLLDAQELLIIWNDDIFVSLFSCKRCTFHVLDEL